MDDAYPPLSRRQLLKLMRENVSSIQRNYADICEKVDEEKRTGQLGVFVEPQPGDATLILSIEEVLSYLESPIIELDLAIGEFLKKEKGGSPRVYHTILPILPALRDIDGKYPGLLSGVEHLQQFIYPIHSPEPDIFETLARMSYK